MPPLTAAVVLRSLVPAPGPGAVPDGWTLLDADLSAGVPARFPLTPDLTLVLILPTGVARAWQRLDPGTVVTSTNVPGLELPGPRLLLLQANELVAAVPLTRGLTRTLPADPARPARITVRPLDWHLTAGCVAGATSTGNRFRLAWTTPASSQDWR